MEIEPIFNSDAFRDYSWMYNRRAFGTRKQSGKSAPIDAFTFDKVSFTEKASETSNTVDNLISYIKSMPEDVMRDRVKKMIRDYESLDDALIDKIIMEEL